MRPRRALAGRKVCRPMRRPCPDVPLEHTQADRSPSCSGSFSAIIQSIRSLGLAYPLAGRSEQLRDDQRILNSLAEAGASATGALSAQQATNELLYLQALLAAQSRAEALEHAREMEVLAQARAMAQCPNPTPTRKTGSQHSEECRQPSYFRVFLERARRFERPTPTLARSCSTPELRPHPEGKSGGEAGMASLSRKPAIMQGVREA